MSKLDPEQVRAIDQARQRLLTLHTSITALRTEIATSQNPLPSWTSLQTHTNLISNNIQSIASQLSEHQQPLSSTVAFPLPQFPGKYQGHVAEMLLRTKLEPEVEEWVEQGEKMATSTTTARSGLSAADREELWQWAPRAANAEARKQTWGADYTLQEKKAGVHGVRTGLRRTLVEPHDPTENEDGEEEEDEYEYEEVTDDESADKMDVEPGPGAENTTNSAGGRASSDEVGNVLPSAPQMPLASLHRFMTQGKFG